jgi:hypothetical protein
MLPRTCIVVPTYWTREGGEPRHGDAVYDHPTALGGPDTLHALLESLTMLRGEFYVLLLVAVTANEVAERAEAQVREIAECYTGFPALVFGAAHLDAVHARLRETGLGDATSAVALTNYPNIRNLQLAVPLALGSREIIALDDDEVVVEPEFLHRATEPLGSRVDGVIVDGLSGHYLQDDGGIMLKVDPDKADSSNLFDRKASIMNEATEMLERRQGNIVPTPFCFGGNMEFTAELAASVGFDPGITRGEDIDYLINARLEGRTFFLRKDLTILHRPPRGGSYKDSNISKLQQDVIRFLYERAKLEISRQHPDLQTLTAADLMPYPGEFLGRDIEGDAVEALRAAGYGGDPTAFVAETRAGAAARMDRYLLFRHQWPRLTAALLDPGALRDTLLRAVQGAL